ncbi:MAG: WD40-repeat-containing domain protein [Benniella sp.]|nr:MAG: WD40-repeat-containing domain protein [Benniella sp.]
MTWIAIAKYSPGDDDDSIIFTEASRVPKVQTHTTDQCPRTVEGKREDRDPARWKAARSAKNQTVIDGIATAYIDLGRLLEIHKHGSESQAMYKKGQKLGGNAQDTSRPTKFARPNEATLNTTIAAGNTLVDNPADNSLVDQCQQHRDAITIPTNIFGQNVRPPTIEFKLPEADERLNNTSQLAYCLELLQVYSSSDEQLDPPVYKWLQTTTKDADEQERLHTTATEVIRVFKRDEIKDAKVVAGVVSLAHVLSKDAFQDLLREFYTGIDHSGLLDFHQLEGLARVIQGAHIGHLNADDLVKILVLLSNRLKDTHRQSTEHMYQLTLAVSNVLDAMADTRVTGLNREKLHEPLSNYLSGLKGSSNPYLVYIERGKKRLGEKDLNLQAKTAFESLTDEGFTLNGIAYLKNLAVAIYKEQGGYPIVEYSRFVDGESWKAEFFGQEDKGLLREACPLTRNGNQHRFIHRSLLEYGLARAVFDPQDKRKRKSSGRGLGCRGSTSSMLSIDSHDFFDLTATDTEQEPDINSPLVWRTFVDDHSLMQFLEERVRQEPVFKQQLFAYIEHSKKDKKWRKAAANAITILVRAGVQFNGVDLKGIQIPRADLSYGVFDSAQLQDADLRRANLRGVWMRQTDLSRAQMTELPFLKEDGGVQSCAYSADGMAFVVGLQSGDINLYATSNWERIRTLYGYGNGVRYVAYSPKGNQIASSNDDKTVRLWDSEAGSLQHILIGHTAWSYCIAYSPQGDQVASASADSTVRLWDVITGDCLRTLRGHDSQILGVTYSPKGEQIASSSMDSTVRLWNVDTGECIRILSGHDEWVWRVAYSPQGDQIASSGQDRTVRLWDVETGVCGSILTGHADHIMHVAYSRNGDQLASSSVDGTVRLWDVESGLCRQILTGHTNSVIGGLYSPNDNQLASCSWDHAVRLWDVSIGASRSVSSGHSGHSDSVFGMAFSPHEDRLVSGSGDKTVRLWDVETGICLHTFTGHSNTVEGVAYSPQGDVVASASDDMTVRLWNLSTGECQRTLEGHTKGVRGIAYSPNGNRIASGSMDNTVRIWDASTGECCQILVGHTDWVRDVVYSPQGHQLASASYDKAIRLWDVETGESHMMLTGHSDKIRIIAYSQEGDLLASGSWDKTVRLWDVATGQCRALLQNFEGGIQGVAWIDNHLVTSGGDASVLKWEVTKEDDHYGVRLLWCATNSALTMPGASIQGVRGLSQVNKHLLKQRGVQGEPENTFRGASKKLVAMTSAASMFKQHRQIPLSTLGQTGQTVSPAQQE